jgi:hypothetical protein
MYCWSIAAGLAPIRRSAMAKNNEGMPNAFRAGLDLACRQSCMQLLNQRRRRSTPILQRFPPKPVQIAEESGRKP